MHEISLAEAIRETALRHARLAGASRILSVRVVIAEFSSYLEDALAMFWDEICSATAAAGARIEFQRVPGRSVCLECSESFAIGPDGSAMSRVRQRVAKTHQRTGMLRRVDRSGRRGSMTMPIKTIQVSRSAFSANRETAEQNRAILDAAGVAALNLMASPGAGKTSLIERTIKALEGRLRIGMINSDTSPAAMDAERGERAGAVSVHLDTAGRCHLDAGMVREALECLPLHDIDILFIENIGNLVCPAAWQLGSHFSVLVASTPEGDDKPYKYPRMYSGVDVLVINKIDLLPYVSFDLDYFTRGVEGLNHGLRTFPLSCRSGAGLDPWFDWIESMAVRKNAVAK